MICKINNQEIISDKKKPKELALNLIFGISFRGFGPKMQQVKIYLFFEDRRSMKSLHGYMGVFLLCSKTM